MKFLRSIFILLNILAVLALVSVKVGSEVSPNTFMPTSYASLGLLPLLAVHVGFVLFWALLRRWYLLISLVALIAFGGTVKSAFPVNLCKPGIDTARYTGITMLTYNTMNTAMMKKHLPDAPNPVVKYILDADADIVCLQEFAFSERNHQFQEKDFERIFSHYPHKHVSFQINKWNMNIGVATLSKFPIIEKRNVDYHAEFNLSIYSDIVIGRDTVRVINNHLESNRITAKDMEETIELKNDFSSERLSAVTKYLSRKLSIAYRVRANQADIVAKLIKESPHKVISCGDYNDVPASYTYTTVKGSLKDAFKEIGSGTGWTFVHSLYRFRIDYIMYDKSFRADNYKVGVQKASDHYPIQVDLYLPREE